ncbi:MAG TPA: hypothetical protein VGH89_27430 [Pseudonocardia sp.]
MLISDAGVVAAGAPVEVAAAADAPVEVVVAGGVLVEVVAAGGVLVEVVAAAGVLVGAVAVAGARAAAEVVASARPEPVGSGQGALRWYWPRLERWSRSSPGQHRRRQLPPRRFVETRQ